RAATATPLIACGDNLNDQAANADVVRNAVFDMRDFATPLGTAWWAEPTSWSLARAVSVPLSLANASLEGDDSVSLVDMFRQRARARAAAETPEVVHDIRLSAADQELDAGETPVEDGPSRSVMVTSILVLPVLGTFV